MRKLSCRSILIVAVLAPAASSLAYPIAPQTLWGLVEGADLIVLADVQSIVEPEPADPDARAEDTEWLPWIAHLRVMEVWKGESHESLRVNFEANMICPAPARYEQEHRVIAFLSRSDDEWSTFGLSYGSLYPHPEEVLHYRDLVESARDIQSLRKRKRREAKIAWAVLAARHPATRWHGLYELASTSDSVHSFYDPNGKRLLMSRLSDEQLSLIAGGFTAEPRVDLTFPMVLAVLEDFASEEVDLTSLAVLETALDGGYAPYWLEEAMLALLRRFGDSQAAERVSPLSAECCSIDLDLARATWVAAKQDLGLPEMKPVESWRPVVRGVGESTPD